jgi:phage repressor protein C with HTH and peptisase S24 domain
MKINTDFANRFADVCGTAEAAKVQRLLNIPYQSAKNYLNGRLPQAEVLILISERTGCSIDWLLTGRGKKFLSGTLAPDTPLSAGQIASVRSICVEVINEMNGATAPAQSRIVRLQSSELMSEAVQDEALTSSGRQP